MAEDTPPWEDYGESPVQAEEAQGPWEDYEEVKPALPKGQPWQLTPEGTKPYGGPLSGGPFSPYQEENMQEVVASMTTPNIRLPQFHPKGLAGKIIAGPVNLALGMAESATSPFGAAIMGAPATRVTRPIFTAYAAKQAYDAARRARETKDPQDISAAIAAGAFAGWLARGHVRSRGEPTPITEPVPETPKIAHVEPEIAPEATAAPPAPETPPVTESAPKPVPEAPAATPALTPEPVPEPVAVPELTLEPPKPGPEPILAQPMSEVGPGTIGEEEMGAAGVHEIGEGSATSLKNAVADAERAGLGLADAPEHEAQNMVETMARAAQTEATTPGAGEALAKELLANPARRLTGDDSALLLRYKRTLLNNLNDAAEKTHIGDAASRVEAQAQHDLINTQLNNLLDAVKQAGSHPALEFRWRQALLKEDFTFQSADEMNRYYRTLSGRDMVPEAKPTAEKISGRVKKATAEADAASNAVMNEIKAKAPPAGPDLLKAEKDAFDAAKNMVREKAIAVANAENASRLARTKQERAIAKEQEKAARKAQDAVNKMHREAAIAVAKAEMALRDDPVKAVWDKVREQLDRGEDNFDDIRNKVALALGMKADSVARIMGRDKTTKRLMDDAWKKQQQARILRQEAKRWVAGLNTPDWEKYVKSVPRVFFGLKTFGHGTVPLGTHAPFVLFDPRHTVNYLKRYGTLYHMVFNKAFYEQQVQDLQRRPNYIPAQRGGLVNKVDAYEDYINPELVKYITGGQVGTRGFFVLKILRQDMFDRAWNKLPRNLQTDEMAAGIANGINHMTGVTKAMAPRGIGTALFAPRLFASRVATLAVDPAQAVWGVRNWRKATPAQRAAAVEQLTSKLLIGGTLYALLNINQGLLTATGSNQEINLTDPMRSDFLKFKAAGMDFAYGNALISQMRLPASLYRIVSSDGGKTKNLVYADESAYTVLGRFTRSQLSPYMGTLTDLGFGSDYASRPLPSAGFGLIEQTRPVPKRLKAKGYEPYTWPEYWWQQLSPIPGQELIHEVWRHGIGMSDEQIEAYEKAVAASLIMAATGGRVSEDIPERRTR